MLIKGCDLNARQRQQVLAAFVYHGIAIGDGKPYADDNAWLEAHSFYFIKDGSRLARQRYAEPAWRADFEREGRA